MATAEMLSALTAYDEADALLTTLIMRWIKPGLAEPELGRLGRICKQASVRRARRWHIFILASRREI